MTRFKNKMGELNYFEYFAFTKCTLLFLFGGGQKGDVGLAALKDFSKCWMGFSDSVHRYYSNLTISAKHATPKNNRGFSTTLIIQLVNPFSAESQRSVCRLEISPVSILT